MPFFFIFVFIFFATAAFLYHPLSFTRILFWHFWSAVFLLLHFFSFLPISKMPDCFFTRSFQILLFWTSQWQDSINVPSLQIPHIQNHNREAKSLCYVSSHPLKWDEIPQVIPIKMGWSRLYSSMKFNLRGTGGPKGASKHMVAELIGVMVSPSWYSRCIFRTQLVSLCYDVIPLLHHGHKSCLWDLLTPCSHLYGVFTESSCVSVAMQKNLSCLNNFPLAVHQITFGGRPTQTSLITGICRNAVLKWTNQANLNWLNFIC